MASDIPACGIQEYMDGEVLRHARENWANKPYRFLDRREPWVLFLGLAVLLALITFFLDKPVLEEWARTGLVLLLITMLGLMSLCGWARIAPLEWKRHPVFGLTLHYGGREVIFQMVRHIRMNSPTPDADFEVAVLDHPDRGPFGFVLFQMNEHYGTLPAYAKNGGKPIAIFDGAGRQQQFGENYIPFGAFPKFV